MMRVVITGMGAISACGRGTDRLIQSALSGSSGVRPIAFPDILAQRVGTAAVLENTVKQQVADERSHRMRDPVSNYALCAASEAVEQAGLQPGDFGDTCGVSIGSGFGGAQTLNTNYMRFAVEGKMRLDPMSVPKTMNNAAASWVSMEFGATGPAYCLATACSSASQSIGLAFQLIRAGVIDRCLAGGAEAPLESGVFRSWELLRVMTATKNRPFSKDRNGMILGEGAGVLVMESLESAELRGANILCEIAGYGTNSDAGDLLRPDPMRAASCMNIALNDANMAPADIGYVNAHGTGTVANDLNEVKALRRIFGEELAGVEISSTKPIHGHALGAAGALEAIVAIGALRAKTAPPTINFNENDPKINLDPVANTARPITNVSVMSNSLAFGGINATLIFRAHG